jgi:ribosomal protein S18 acetylase RimI-like enzyme
VAYVVRYATDADLTVVSEIKVRNWAETYGPLLGDNVIAPFLDQDAQLEALRKQASDPDTLLLVADDGNNVVGFALTFVSRDPVPWLESLHVIAEVRGHGVGTLLMRATAARLLASGHTGMRLGVIVGNDSAARFYERLEGLLMGVEPVTFAAGVSHWVYGWPDLSRLAQ